MAAPKIDVRLGKEKPTNMDYMIIQAAREKAAQGFDQLTMRLFIEVEIENWKKRDKWRNAKVELDVRSNWEMALMSGGKEVALFKTIH